ncbi:PfkB family carbohydrate kinase [Methylomonas rivi]|uniref:PfkB family carbohydrate kinase n=1 Tax=Methylomonas rivi TaxID=2952226 RepID=A0ABT1U6V6_9GAMM|nr:PfkB family carbohydrate kinase [Methylomonas sp. WSC-6]MCQ8129587.1 PfkB family carbohydrate kinase [Methylomonas sp. WSC-6]
MNNSNMQIFGEVLFDHFPDGSVVLGGAPFNVAWHLQAFKQNPCFISRIGEDDTGAAVQAGMENWQMDLSGLQHDARHPTGAVQVKIERGEPSYSIMPEQAYDFIDAGQLPANATGGLLYHGSLALRNAVSRQALARLKQNHRGPVFLDVNLREPWWDKAEVLFWADQADWVKLNHLELRALQAGSDDFDVAMQAFLAEHRLQGLVVTRSEKGAVAINADGQRAAAVPVKALQVVDTVGAGDAFASVLMLGIHLDWPLQLILERAQTFASGIVGRRGATVQDAGFYRSFVEAWGL